MSGKDFGYCMKLIMLVLSVPTITHQGHAGGQTGARRRRARLGPCCRGGAGDTGPGLAAPARGRSPGREGAGVGGRPGEHRTGTLTGRSWCWQGRTKMTRRNQLVLEKPDYIFDAHLIVKLMIYRILGLFRWRGGGGGRL